MSKGPRTKERRITIRVSAELGAVLDARAEEEKQTLTWVIERALYSQYPDIGKKREPYTQPVITKLHKEG